MKIKVGKIKQEAVRGRADSLRFDNEQLREQLRRAEMIRKLLASEITCLQNENKLLGIYDKAAAGTHPMAIRPLLKKAPGEACALAVASDWHLYERVLPAEVSGLNEYNPAIARASCEEFFRAVVKWTCVDRSAVKVPQLILALLGDLLTNQLHIDQVECNAGTVQEEFMFALEILTGGIDFLLKEGGFDKIIVPCCDGNHGRDTEKIRVSNRVRHSHEWLLYNILRKMYANEPRIEFVIADGIHLYMDVYGRTVRFHHGDAMKYQGGIGGLTIPVKKAIGEWNKARRADLDVFGHWHTTIDDVQFISNGSGLGYAPYSLSIKAAFERPTQSFALLDKDRWITAFDRMYLR